MIVIELRGAPQGKGRPRFVRATGHVYTPAETRKYEEALRAVALATMGRQRPLEGPLCVVVEALFPVPESWSKRQWERAVAGAVIPTKRPDVDNILKMLDALNGIVWRDDAQISTATIRKRYSNSPALVVRVCPEAVDGRLFDAEAA